VIGHARALFAIAALVCGIVLCLGAGSALAADHPERPELNHEGLNLPCGAATDSQGNLYLSAPAAGDNKVLVYDEEGEPLTSFATSASTASPCSLAVDASGSVYVTGLDKDLARYKPSSFPPTAGTTYAPDTTIGAGSGILVSEAAASVAVDPETQNAYVAQQALGEQHVLTFNGFANGNKFTLTCDGETTAEISFSAGGSTRSTNIKNALEAKCGTGNFLVTSAGSGTGAPGTSTITYVGKYLGLDVSPLIACTVISGTGTCTPSQGREAKPTRISSFQPNGTLISDQIGAGLLPQADYYGIDVHGESGKIYVTDRAHNKALILSPDGSAILEEIDGSEAPSGPFEMQRPYLAVDQADGHVFVSDIVVKGATVNDLVVDEFDQEGKYLAQISHTPALTESTVAPSDIAVDSGSASENRGTIYVTSSGDGRVYAFGPDPHDPPLNQLTVEKTGAGAGIVTSAPAGVDCGSTCTGEFANGKVVTLSAKPSAPGSVFGAWVSGCDSIAEGKCVVAMSEARTVSVRFDSRPVVTEESASEVTASSAQLTAKVDPQGKATTYFFEYITEADWLANGESFSGADPASKTSPVAIGSGNSAIAVGVKVGGLEPSTTYRFRVTATNDIGTAEGERDPKTDEEIARSFTTYSLPQVFIGDCPGNETLRTGASANLPDCRAYEQASPIDKNGGSIQGSMRATRTAELGDAISFESTTGVPGGSGAQTYPTYVARRTSGSWSTTGLLPDPSSGQRAAVLGWTSDFATAFDQAELLGLGSSMLARSTVDGAETEIVPHTLPAPEYGYLGASADRSKVLFEASPSDLAPGAASGKPNVYAWDRGTGELHLAGVLPDGTTPPEGSRVGRGEKALEYNQDNHVVADDGSVLFSDPGDGQLYLRLNPTAADASTVHVSASQKDNGEGPEGRDSVGPQTATLMAASTDGSVITFTSSEKLTNDAKTGPEPDAPAIARAKASNGGEKDLEFIRTFAHEIAIDDVEEYVYWSDPANGRIGRAKLDGTEFNDSYITGLGEPLGIAVINEPTTKYIFWTERGELDEEGKAQAGKGKIGRADLDGTNVDEDCLKELTNPRSIAADASFIYWTMPEGGQGNGDLGRADLMCPGNVPLPLIDNGLASGDVVVNASHIYFSFMRSNGSTFIRRSNLDGTGQKTIIEDTNDSDDPMGIALNGTHLYWTSAVTQTIGRSDLDGTNASEEPNFITAAGRPVDPAVLGEHLYWITNQKVVSNPGTDIYQLDRESGELTDLAPDTTSTNGVEVQGVLGASEDGAYVYFAANGVPDGVGNSPNEMGEVAEPGNCEGSERLGGVTAAGTCNLYVAHDEEVDFIARLDAKRPWEATDSGDTLNWAAGHIDVRKEASDKTARVSPDGGILVFRSSRQLTDYKVQGPRCGATKTGTRMPGPCLEFYRFDFADKHIACLTCDPRGTTPEGTVRLWSLTQSNIAAPPPARLLGRNLSREGDRFFFETPEALVAQDTNGEDGCPDWGASGVQEGNVRACQDVYEWEAPGTGSCTESSSAYSSQNEGCIYLISTGKSKEPNFFADADLDGENVFIFSFEQLVPQDKDELLDAYDARVGGGLASQHQVDSPLCVGEACKAPPSAPLAPQTPGSASFTGPANLKDRKPKTRRCAKGKRRVRAKGKVRCIAKRSKRAAEKSRRAGR
jgi:virginiamycin B lyase